MHVVILMKLILERYFPKLFYKSKYLQIICLRFYTYLF